MHNKETPAARRNQNESSEGIERLELLMWRFSEAEIERLSQLQLCYRQRLHALDLPLEEGRLRFARWLVDNGRLSEHTECRREGQPWAREALGEASEVLSCQGCVPAARAGLPAGEYTGEPLLESAQRQRPAAASCGEASHADGRLVPDTPGHGQGG